jgi:hypothetical protein
MFLKRRLCRILLRPSYKLSKYFHILRQMFAVIIQTVPQSWRFLGKDEYFPRSLNMSKNTKRALS